MPISFTQSGSFPRNTLRYLKRLQGGYKAFDILQKYGDMGVAALSSATPMDTGESAKSWYYTIVQEKGYYSIRWHNSHVRNGIPIVVLIQYGHGTKNGGIVQGRDFINPAIRPIFEAMGNDAWKEVTKI
jgi:hypothetical protein